jgi:hypothetical protein
MQVTTLIREAQCMAVRDRFGVGTCGTVPVWRHGSFHRRGRARFDTIPRHGIRVGIACGVASELGTCRGTGCPTGTCRDDRKQVRLSDMKTKFPKQSNLSDLRQTITT